MHSFINSFYPLQSKFKNLKIFGYSSKSIPSIEVVGLQGRNKILKEKIVYLSKIYQIKIPHMKYVLCFEGINLKEVDPQFFQYFELPLFLLFLHLSGNTSLERLESCAAIGSFDASGKLNSNELELSDYTWIGESEVGENRIINFHSILKDNIKLDNR